MLFTRKATAMPTPEDALPGRDTPIVVPGRHLVLGTPIGPPFPEGTERAIFGMGCFWGAERMFWRAPGIYTTAVGYSGGYTPNPTYQEVCTGRTGHNEVVLAVFDTSKTSYEAMLRSLLGGPRPDPGHAPGQRRRHAVPLGDLLDVARRSATPRSRHATCSRRSSRAPGYGTITTEIVEAGPFYYAEDYHQQYLEARR